MKLLTVTESMGSGVLTVLSQVLNGLASRHPNIEMTTLYGRRPDTPSNLTPLFHPHIVLRELTSEGQGLRRYLQMLREIRDVIGSVQPDILHLHSSKAGFLGRVANRLRKDHQMTQVFYSPHGFSFLMRNQPSAKRAVFYLLEYFAATLGGSLVAVGEDEATVARDLSQSVITIPNFVEASPGFDSVPENRSRSSNRLSVTTVGRVCPQKNPELFNRIALQFPEHQFTWVGGGELASCLTAPNIHITGYVDKDEVFRILTQTDVYIQCSKWEGLPMAVLEAMSIGLPVVLSDVRGHRELSRRCIHQLCAADEQAFVQRITEFSRSPQTLIRVGLACRDVILENYTAEVGIRRYEELYGLVRP